MLITYVHGAGASERSFNWLKSNLPKHNANFATYGISEAVLTVCARFSKQLNEPTILLGHSLGGIISTLCVDNPYVQKLITLCAPFGGVRHANILSMFSFEPLFHDLSEHSLTLTSARTKIITKPHLAIVGTSGLPFTHESNDGVITVNSQMARQAQYKLLPLNHFEVLLSDEVVSLITSFIKD